MDEFKLLLNCNISDGESFDYNYKILIKYIIKLRLPPLLFKIIACIIVIINHYNCGYCRSCSNNN